MILLAIMIFFVCACPWHYTYSHIQLTMQGIITTTMQVEHED